MSDFTAPATGNYLAQVPFGTEQIQLGQVRSGMTSARPHTQRLVPNGTVAAFAPRGGVGAGKKFVDGSAPQSLVANIGDVRSLVMDPASRTHSHLAPDERSASGAIHRLVRPTVGIRDSDTDPRAGFAAAAA
ncbi:PLP-dependent transferase [Nocardia sp. NBC_00881]|uniref:PLP-dependent transferase n=1 Tax=Nocardia sp. NBC_00881 TaxID=2975995 RepID=UPI00387002D4